MVGIGFVKASELAGKSVHRCDIVATDLDLVQGLQGKFA
jgi:hypothetical protein